jgi:hypothetical protein
MKCQLQISHTNITSDDLCYLSNSIKQTNAVDCGVLTVHESNAPFPITRHHFRMMCDKDILQFFFEDLN